MTDAGRESSGTVPIVNRLALAAGKVVGRYRIVGLLGQGGFGVTYRARDLRLDREVALKEYLPVGLAVRAADATLVPRALETADDFAWGRERFVAECRILAGLHEAPGIVRVFDFLEANGTAYMVMELVRGETLEARLRAAGPLPAAMLRPALACLLDGLERVHAAGFLHRDIKPANILIAPDGRPVLIDFGAARAAIAGRSAAMTAVFTPGFAAPEQFSSGKQGPWTDIYGLAATLHCAIVGQPPPAAFDRLMDGRYEPLHGRRLAGYPARLLAGVDAGLSLVPKARPPSIAAWRPMFLDGPERGAVPDLRAPDRASATSVPPDRAARRRRRPVGVLAAGLLLLLAIAILVSLDWSGPQPPAVAHPIRPESTRREALAAAEPAVEATARPSPGGTSRTGEPPVASPPVTSPPVASLLPEAAAPTAPPAAGAPVVYAGSLSESSTAFSGGPRLLTVSLARSGAILVGRIVYPRCGVQPTSLAVAPSGEVTGVITVPDWMACTPTKGSARGWLTAQGLQLELHGLATVARGSLARAPSAAGGPPGTGGPGGAYAGVLSAAGSNGPAGLRLLAAELRVAAGRLTGRLVDRACGAIDVDLAVPASGEVDGILRLPEAATCSLTTARITGRASAATLVLEIRGPSGSLRGTLGRTD